MPRHLYKPKGSNNWHVRFTLGGIDVDESTHTANLRDAKVYLDEKRAEVQKGAHVPRAGTITVAQIVDDKLASDKVNASDSYDTTEGRWRLHLKPFFGIMRAATITTALLTKYAEVRLGEGAQNSTVNREFALLRAAYRLAKKSRVVADVPWFPMLKEDNVRKGFLRDDQYPALAAACAKEGLWLRGMLEVANSFGWRKRSIRKLKVGDVDFFANTLTTTDTKNGDPVMVKMTAVLRALLVECTAGKNAEDYIFTRDGVPVVDIRDAWERATAAAQVPDLLFHDLCRTGMRNMRRLGLSEGVIMKAAGRKTASIFRRYDIVDEADLVDVAARLDEKSARVVAIVGQKPASVSEPEDGQTKLFQ